MQYNFPLALETDATAIFALYRSMIGTPGCTWSDNYPIMDIVVRDIRLQSLYTLKDTTGEIIAAATAGADDELTDLNRDIKTPCELARVAVALPLQNRGIGSLLLRQIIPAVQARGFDGICMLVNKHHPHALALYEKNGFIRYGEVKRYGFDFYMYRMKFER